MGQSVCKGKDCEDCTCCPITAEDVHRVLLQAYGVVTDCKKSFEERKKTLCCLREKYKCFINPYFPDIFSFKKDCFGYEYFFLIATVKKFAVDLVLYWDLQDWVVLNSGSCYRHYYTGGCSKLDKSVALRKPCRGEFKKLYEAKKRQVKCVLDKKCCESSSSSSSCSSSSSSSSCSSSSSSCSNSSSSSCPKKCKKPEICIISPKNHSKVSCDFCLKFKVKHAKDHCLEWCWAGKKGGKVKEKNQVKIHLEEAKKGWHCVDLKLLDKCGKVVACKKMKFYLCKSCCHSSSSSSSSSCFVSLSGCQSSSSSSSSSCSSSSSSSWCKKCKSSSSSCSCSSSSSSSTSWCKKCKSSSSSCSCSSSSSSSWCKKCKSSSCSCSSSSSSSSCSSSSSTSWCKKCKSSSSSCSCSSSSSSSTCNKCKSSSSSCSCSSSSSSSTCNKCKSSSSSCSCSSSSSSSTCVNPYEKKYRVSCGNYGWDRKKYGSYTLKKRFDCCKSSSSSSSSSCPSSSSSSSSRIYWKRKC